ncbi:phage tail tape measure protein [Halorubrum ezzemoulense]|nr:phage tail tape measure protein [Halorubrum ezzemoulense]
MAITGGGAAEEVQVAISGDAEGLNEATNSALDSLGSLRKAAGLASAALAGLGATGLGAAATAAANFEEQMVGVEKVTNPETAERMGDAIQEMASKMPVAQKELADITAQAGRFGIQGTEDIERFTETVSKMAIATDLSTTQAGESMARLSTLMDTPISRVGDMGNVVNELSNTMATSSSEIVDSALRSSGTLSQLGASSEDIFALNAAMNAASESAERAGTRLRRMSQEIQDPKKVEDLSAALGMSTEEFSTMREESPVDLFRTMASTMGEGGEAADALRSTLSTTSQQALTAMAQNMEGLADAQEAANEQMENGTSLQEEYAAAADTFKSELQVVGNQLRNIGIQIGENVLPVLSDLLSRISNAIASFSSINEESDGMIGTMALVGTTLAGLGGIIAYVVSYFGGLSAIVGTVGSVLATLTLPITAVITALGALVAALATDFGNARDIIDDFAAFVDETFGLISEIAEDSKRAFSPIAQDAADFRDRVEGVVASAVNVVESLLQRARVVLQRLRAYWEANGEGIAESVAESYGDIRDRIESAIEYVQEEIFAPFVETISDVWGEHGDALVSETEETWDVIQGEIQKIVDVIQRVVQRGLDRVQQFWDRHGERIMSIVERAFNVVATVVGVALENLVTVVRALLAVLRGDFDEAWELISNRVEEAMEFVADVVESGLNRVVQFVTGIGRRDIKRAFKRVGRAIRTVIIGLFGAAGTLFGILKDFISNVATYIGSGQALADLKRAFSLLMDGIVGAVKVALGAGGTVIGVVKDLIEDIASYISSGQAFSDIKSAFKTLIDGIMAVFEGLYEGLIGNSLIPDMMSDIKSELLDWTSWVRNSFADLVGGAFGDVAEGIANSLSGISINWPTLPDWLADALDNVSGGIEDAIDWVEDQAPGGSSGDSSDDDGGSSGGGSGGGSPGGGGGSSGGGGGDGRDADDPADAPSATPPGQVDDGNDNGYDPGDDSRGGIGNPDYGTGLATGGFIESGGRATLHDNELVLPESQVSDRGEASFDASSVAEGFDESQVARGMRADLDRLYDAVAALGEELDVTIEFRDEDRYREVRR